jgi:hypothetical protein
LEERVAVGVWWICLTGLMALALGYAAAIPRRDFRRLDRKLRALTTDELAEEARLYARNAGYDATYGNALLFRQLRDWSPAALTRALDELYLRAALDDGRGRNGDDHDKQVRFYYQSGLAYIRDFLDKLRRA